jgi:hypothetical protein
MCKRRTITIENSDTIHTFEADVEMIPLLEELNNLGLRTRSHCYGHTTKVPHIAIMFDNIEDVQIRTLSGGKKDLVITWKRP